jgi:ABC-2 type transport system permease protein
VTPIRLQLAAGAAILQRDLYLFLSYRTAAITRNLSVVFQLALLYYISKLVTLPSFQSKSGYFAYVVVGILILRVTEATFSLPNIIRNELVAGTYERMLLSPMGARKGTTALMIFPFVDALFSAIITIVVAVLVFGVDLEWDTAALALPVAALGTFAFAGISMLFASLVIVFKQAPGMGFLLSVMSLAAGYYFPIDLLPWWAQWVSEVQPFTPTVDLLRHVLVGFPPAHPVWVLVLKLAGFGAVLLPLGVVTIGRALEVGRRRGTIIEY